MLYRYAISSVVYLFLVFSMFVGLATAQDLPPRRAQSDAAQDEALECFECSRGDLLTFDMLTGRVIRRTPAEGVPDVLRLMSEGGQGALVPPGGDEALKDFTYITPVWDTTVGDYPKHVKINSKYLNEHGEIVSSGCSGTMIDPFHVLTAGHCVYKFEDKDGNVVDDWAYEVRVRPGYHYGVAHFGQAYSVQLHSWSGWTEDEDYDWDVAVIDLQWPIGATTGWRGYGSDPNCSWYTGGDWTHYGYPGEDPYDGTVMYYQTGTFDGCESVGNEVWFDRDMYKGQSGGGCVRDGGLYTVRSNSTWVGPDDWDTYDVRLTNTMWYDITGWIDDDIPGTFDLMPINMTVTEDLVRGEYFTFDFLLHNYSSVTATGTWPVNVYLSVDNNIDWNDDLIGTVDISGPIGPKQTVSKHIGIDTDCYINPWPYFLGVCVNIGDADFGNNWTESWHAVPLTVQSQTTPPTPLPTHPNNYTQCHDLGGVMLMWTNSGPGCEYQVQLGTTPGSGDLYTTTSTHYQLWGLTPGVWYYWRVRAELECSSWSGWSNSQQFHTIFDTGIQAEAVYPSDGEHCVPTSTTLYWTPLYGAETYDVQLDQVDCTLGDIFTGISSPLLVVSDLVPNSAYSWRVRAHTTCGQTSLWSSTGQSCFTFRTELDTIGAPYWRQPQNGTTCGNPNTPLSWGYLEVDENYEVQIGTSCGTGEVHMVENNNILVSDLESGVVYHWRVRAFHECNDLVSDWSECWTFSLDLTLPENPSTLTSGSHQTGVWSGDDTVDAEWDLGSDNCWGIFYAMLWDRSPVTEITEPPPYGDEYTWTTSLPLEDADDHWFHLCAMDYAGNLAIETMHLGPFWIDTTGPSDVVITRVSLPPNLWGDYGELTVEWDPSTDGASGVAGYSYTLEQSGGSDPDATVDTTLESITLPIGSGNHWFRILAADAVGNMGATTEAGPFLVDELLPAFLVPVAGQEAVEDELLQVQWEEPIFGIGSNAALHLSLDGGQSFTQISSLTDEEFLGGLYAWTVPSETTPEAVLKLTFEAAGTNYTAGSPVFSLRAITEVEEDGPQVARATLAANYPNPFNPHTTIAYALPAETRVRVTILDALGRCVRTLVDWQERVAGRHEVAWDGTDDRGLQVASGVYFYSLETPDHRELRRMTLVK